MKQDDAAGFRNCETFVKDLLQREFREVRNRHPLRVGAKLSLRLREKPLVEFRGTRNHNDVFGRGMQTKSKLKCRRKLSL